MNLRSASSWSRPFLWIVAIRLQNIVTTSSRTPVRTVWSRLTINVSRLSSSSTLRRSATSVTRASPAKCAILPGGMPSASRSPL